MSYCSYCGVKLDSDMEVCPLCGLAIGREHIETIVKRMEHHNFMDKALSEYRSLSMTQKRILFLEVSGIILVSGIIVTALIDLIISKRISWSIYNIVASLSILANISFFTFFRNKFIFLVIGSFVTNATMLLLLDLVGSGSNIGWGSMLGLPILLTTYILVIIVIWLIRISNWRGFNILALVFIAVGIFLVCIEFFVSLYLYNSIRLRWSIIAGSSIIPISALLFFVHYRLKAGIELKRFFNV